MNRKDDSEFKSRNFWKNRNQSIRNPNRQHDGQSQRGRRRQERSERRRNYSYSNPHHQSIDNRVNETNRCVTTQMPTIRHQMHSEPQEQHISYNWNQPHSVGRQNPEHTITDHYNLMNSNSNVNKVNQYLLSFGDFQPNSNQIPSSTINIQNPGAIQDDMSFFQHVQENFPGHDSKIPGLDAVPDASDDVPNRGPGMQEQTGGLSLFNIIQKPESVSNIDQGGHIEFLTNQEATNEQFQNPITFIPPPFSTPPPPIFQPSNVRVPLPTNRFQMPPMHKSQPPDMFYQNWMPPPHTPVETLAKGTPQRMGQSFQNPPMSHNLSHTFQQQFHGHSTDMLQKPAQPPQYSQGGAYETFSVAKHVSHSQVGNEMDVQWISDWLMRKGKTRERQIQNSQMISSVKVCDVQEKTKRMMFLMASLQKQIRLLSSCDKHQIEEQMRTVSELKKEMDSIRKFLSTVNVEDLKSKVKKRSQKRERLKRQRQQKYNEKQRILEQRQQLHKEIDDRLNKIYQADSDARQQKELKKQADKILSEVRKKTQDVTRAIDLLKNLQKLRKLRKDRLLQQGVHTKPEADADFQDKVQDCLEVLKKQKEVYGAENKALRVMLETEQEETKEKERERKKQLLFNQEIKKQKKEDRMMFGVLDFVDMNDPMYPYTQYYDQANLNLQSLIQIRCDWDRFCVRETTPGGSRIPDGFVIPVKPSSEIWASALKEET